ncbi:MAG: 2-succinyl-5-enolpyruvyl-6-hydroxy-3-cyclohexene-1-carboxylic-acid synthase [Acidimicrobiia bacterium]
MAALFDEMQNTVPETVTATFCATLVDEWVRAGLSEAVVAPGSRSTPMALALLANPAINVHVHHDERSAAFTALGYGLATGKPALVLTTSGTATVELHPAVVEAHQARVPMICITADRPPELHHFGAPQTVDQTHLYGRSTRWFVDPGVPDAHSASSWRGLAARCVLEATGSPSGPVQLNLPFRDPLVGKPGPLPPGRGENAPWFHKLEPSASQPSAVTPLRRLLTQLRLDPAKALPRGVIVAGAGVGGTALNPKIVHRLAARLGWPVLADPRSGCRTPDGTTIAHADMLVRSEAFAKNHSPQLILQFGQLPASRLVNEWLADATAPWVLVDEDGWFYDPARRSSIVIEADPNQVGRQWASQTDSVMPTEKAWLQSFVEADQTAARAIANTLSAKDELSEPAIARAVMEHLEEGSTLVVASSMPVRDLEWYGVPRSGVRVLSNRGANGIDGVTSTAVGVALSGPPTALLIGDVAFLHDTNALIGLAKRPLHLVMVVIDNDGGGIFSFLPQGEQLATAGFETLFGTPHGVDLARLAAAHQLDAVEVTTIAGLENALETANSKNGVHLIIAKTNRQENVVLHNQIHSAWQLG